MKSLIEVTRDKRPPHPIYLYYSREPVARTDSLDEQYSVNVDDDSAGEIIGLEVVVPYDEAIALATRFALEHDLSLVGVFDPRSIGA